MKFIVLILAVLTAVFIAVMIFAESEGMTENEKHIKEAEQKIEAFQSEKEPQRLREAANSLENIILAKEHKAETRHAMRSKILSLWLTLLQILDKNLDPDFNSKDIPPRNVEPPLTANGTAYPAGANPALIEDPQARADYEKAIAENRRKQENYRLQTQFRRLNENIPPRAEDFIRNSYTDSADDQNELKTAFERYLETPSRKADFSKLLASPPS